MVLLQKRHSEKFQDKENKIMKRKIVTVKTKFLRKDGTIYYE